MSGPGQVDYSTKQYVLDWECRHICLIKCIDVLANSPTPDLDEPNPNSFAMRSSTTPGIYIAKLVMAYRKFTNIHAL